MLRDPTRSSPQTDSRGCVRERKIKVDVASRTSHRDEATGDGGGVGRTEEGGGEGWHGAFSARVARRRGERVTGWQCQAPREAGRESFRGAVGFALRAAHLETCPRGDLSGSASAVARRGVASRGAQLQGSQRAAFVLRL